MMWFPEVLWFCAGVLCGGAFVWFYEPPLWCRCRQRQPIVFIDFWLLPLECNTNTTVGGSMADFTLTVGVAKAAIPTAFAADGSQVSWPNGSVFLWESSDPALSISDPAARSPEITGAAVVAGATLKLTVSEPAEAGGYVHTVIHSVEVQAAAPPADTIDHIDFVLQ